MYIMHQLACGAQAAHRGTHEDRAPPVQRASHAVAAGTATLGADRTRSPSAGTTSCRRTELTSPRSTSRDIRSRTATGCVSSPTAARYRRFGSERDGEWLLRGAFEEIPLPRSWPVYVTHRSGRGLCGLDRNALAERGGVSPRGVWNARAARSARFHGATSARRRRTATSISSASIPSRSTHIPRGASAWGVADWSATAGSGPRRRSPRSPGFEPMASYPQYSADFFDGKHYVMKGASPVTAARADPALVPELVLRRLSVHVRKVPLRCLMRRAALPAGARSRCIAADGLLEERRTRSAAATRAAAHRAPDQSDAAQPDPRAEIRSRASPTA